MAELADAFLSSLAASTTTPLKESKPLPPDDHGQATDERVAARNAIAFEYLGPKGIPIDDLNALVRGHPEYYSDNVHFNGQGIALEAAQVASQIEKLLKQ